MFAQLRPAVVSVLVFAALTGLVYPFVVMGLAKVAFPGQANGSLLERNGQVLGSELIGQPFSAPGYFHPRPSAAGSGYNAGKPGDLYTGSGGTNLGPTSSRLILGVRDDPATKGTDESYAGIKQLAEAYRRENGLPANAAVPADAATRSASGLDPHISPSNADLQVPRVARSRRLPESVVRRLVRENTEGRLLGFVGEARVNVLRLNLALDGEQVSEH